MKTTKPIYPRLNFRCAQHLHARIIKASEAAGLKPSELIRSIIHQHLTKTP